MTCYMVITFYHFVYFFFFFFNDTATTEIYTLSLHDALPIFVEDDDARLALGPRESGDGTPVSLVIHEDRKSTRLNSSHVAISYAVFCLKKKKNRRATPSCDNQYNTPHKPT